MFIPALGQISFEKAAQFSQFSIDKSTEDMSFGRPSTVHVFTSTPPDRGSFPLDHDGECKEVMVEYLKCLKANRMDNGQCRHLSKAYLKCRMDRGLMDTDEMQNLGFDGSEDKELLSKNVPS